MSFQNQPLQATLTQMITAAIKIISNLTPTYTVFFLRFFFVIFFIQHIQHSHLLVYALTTRTTQLYQTMATQYKTLYVTHKMNRYFIVVSLLAAFFSFIFSWSRCVCVYNTCIMMCIYILFY